MIIITNTDWSNCIENVINLEVERPAFFQSIWTREIDQEGKGKRRGCQASQPCLSVQSCSCAHRNGSSEPWRHNISTDRCRKQGKLYTAALRVTAMPSARIIKVKLKWMWLHKYIQSVLDKERDKDSCTTAGVVCSRIWIHTYVQSEIKSKSVQVFLSLLFIHIKINDIYIFMYVCVGNEFIIQYYKILN